MPTHKSDFLHRFVDKLIKAETKTSARLVTVNTQPWHFDPRVVVQPFQPPLLPSPALSSSLSRPVTMSRKAKEEKAAAYKSAFEDEDVSVSR